MAGAVGTTVAGAMAVSGTALPVAASQMVVLRTAADSDTAVGSATVAEGTAVAVMGVKSIAGRGSC
ncbi:MAG TPA: hypothetical protein VGU20_20710 [Stellaceae bacterium]|nr:hypothetical protein [Stellaceae bacterium]